MKKLLLVLVLLVSCANIFGMCNTIDMAPLLEEELYLMRLGYFVTTSYRTIESAEYPPAWRYVIDTPVGAVNAGIWSKDVIIDPMTGETIRCTRTQKALILRTARVRHRLHGRE